MGRGTAWVEQDHVRRIVLRERDKPGAANIDLISMCVRFALQRGFNVVLEGILRADHYAVMLEELHREYPGASAWYYLDISFAETVRRHAIRPQETEFSTEDMRGWYRPNDLLSFVDETIIGENSPLTDTVDRIYREALTHAQDIPACTAVDHTTAGTHIDERVR